MPLLALQRDSHVLMDGQVRKHRGDLEGTHETHPRNRRRSRTGDLVAVEKDLAARRRQEMSEEVETGRLAGAVGADQRMDAAATDGQAHVLDCDETLVFLGKALRFEDCAVGHPYGGPSSKAPHSLRSGGLCVCG